MPVARDDLRRDRLRLEAEPLAGDPLELRVGRRVGADRAGELPDAHPVERAAQPLAAAVELERPAGELQPEGRRLGVDAVRAADAERLPVLLGPGDDRCQRPLDALEQERARVAQLQRERRVDDVGRGQPVVEPAALLAEPVLDGVDEGGEVVVRLALELGDPLRRRRDRARPRIASAASRRDDPELGPGVERGELDLEPGRELPLVRPHLGHGRTGVAGDHSADRSERPGRPERLRREFLWTGSDAPRILAASTAAFFALSTPTQATGTPGRHLHDREQRVEAVEDALRRAERNADHRQVGVRRDHARERGREAGAADQHAQPALARRLGVLGDRVRVAVRGADLELVRDPALGELVHRRLHPLAVGLGADEDPDERAQTTRLASGRAMSLR